MVPILRAQKEKYESLVRVKRQQLKQWRKVQRDKKEVARLMAIGPAALGRTQCRKPDISESDAAKISGFGRESGRWKETTPQATQA